MTTKVKISFPMDEKTITVEKDVIGDNGRFGKGLLILWFYNPLFYLAIEPQYLTVLVLHLNPNVLATLGAIFRL